MSTNIQPSQATDTANNVVVPFSRRFPKDIEAIIFEITCYHERVIPVHMSASTITFQGDTGDSHVSFLCFRSSNPVPAVMHVNSNAREIALRHYKCAFEVDDLVSEHTRNLDQLGLTKSRIYVNPTIDIICVETGPRWSLFMKKIKDLRIENIALNKVAWYAPFYPDFNYATCPINGSHVSGWIGESIKTSLWIHNQPTELYQPTRILGNHETFCCCVPMEEANEFTRELAIVQMLQQQENEKANAEGRDRERLQQCPEWLYNNLDTWEIPKNRFLLHWQ